MNFNDVVTLLEKQGQYKNIRSDYNLSVGHNDVISDDRMQKMESNYLFYHRFYDYSSHIKRTNTFIISEEKSKNNNKS